MAKSKKRKSKTGAAAALKKMKKAATAAMKRASTSGVEPGGASEIMVTGFSGYLTVCPSAAGDA